jgi:thiamine kinase-like enzyme
MLLEDSRLYKTLALRLYELRGLLTEAWAIRLDKGVQQIKQSLSRAPILLVAAHNDFTPWNIRVEGSIARVFDWEYANNEQLPLFDPLHFALMPMALKRRATTQIIECMDATMQLCQQWMGQDACYKDQTQALAYLINLCTLYLWSQRGKSKSNCVLESYARIIDYLEAS